MKVLTPCELDKNSYASLIFNAMQQLSENWHLVTDSESDDDKSVLERNYVISLVFQMGKNAKGYLDYETNVFPSGENNKRICRSDDEIKYTYNELYKKEFPHRFVVIPDLVVHTSHNSNASRSNGQYVAVEVKTAKKIEKRAFLKDFFKLNNYLCDLNYKNAIYLIVNIPLTRIENLIKQYFDNNYFYKKDKLENLLFFTQEGRTNFPTIYKLDENYLKLIKKKQ